MTKEKKVALALTGVMLFGATTTSLTGCKTKEKQETGISVSETSIDTKDIVVIDTYNPNVLSNGMEFWFEPYEISQDSETYVINCDDGSAAYLEYITNMSEINLLPENGMLYDYGGTYIGLPDSED